MEWAAVNTFVFERGCEWEFLTAHMQQILLLNSPNELMKWSVCPCSFQKQRHHEQRYYSKTPWSEGTSTPTSGDSTRKWSLNSSISSSSFEQFLCWPIYKTCFRKIDLTQLNQNELNIKNRGSFTAFFFLLVHLKSPSHHDQHSLVPLPSLFPAPFCPTLHASLFILLSQLSDKKNWIITFQHKPSSMCTALTAC